MKNPANAGANLNRTTNFRNTGLEMVDPSKFDARVHMAQKPAALQQHAFTQGGAIHVSPGEGRNLLGHELTHVVQQGQGR